MATTHYLKVGWVTGMNKKQLEEIFVTNWIFLGGQVSKTTGYKNTFLLRLYFSEVKMGRGLSICKNLHLKTNDFRMFLRRKLENF